MAKPSDIVKCDGCNAHGRRVSGACAPDFWFYLESTDNTPGKRRGMVYIIYACSDGCRDALWKRGPGRGQIDEAGSKRMRAKEA